MRRSRRSWLVALPLTVACLAAAPAGAIKKTPRPQDFTRARERLFAAAEEVVATLSPRKLERLTKAFAGGGNATARNEAAMVLALLLTGKENPGGRQPPKGEPQPSRTGRQQKGERSVKMEAARQRIAVARALVRKDPESAMRMLRGVLGRGDDAYEVRGRYALDAELTQSATHLLAVAEGEKWVQYAERMFGEGKLEHAQPFIPDGAYYTRSMKKRMYDVGAPAVRANLETMVADGTPIIANLEELVRQGLTAEAMKTHPDKDRLWRARYDQINAAKNYLAHRALFYAAHRWEGDYALTHREPQITALRKQLLQISTRLTSLLAGLGERANGGQ